MATTGERAKKDSAGQTVSDRLKEPQDFSLVLGGPVFQLFRRSHLSGDALELLHRRVLAITLFVWLPLLLLASLGSTSGGAGRLSFLHDVEVHVRFLVALPVLIFAELIVHSRIRSVVHTGLAIERHIVLPDDMPALKRNPVCAQSAQFRRNRGCASDSYYTFGLWLWNSRVAIESPNVVCDAWWTLGT